MVHTFGRIPFKNISGKKLSSWKEKKEKKKISRYLIPILCVGLSRVSVLY